MGGPLKRQKVEEGSLLEAGEEKHYDDIRDNPKFSHLFNNGGQGCLSDDSDDDYPNEEIKRQFQIYDKQVEESEGFDIDFVPAMAPLAGIVPLDMTHCGYAKHYGPDVEKCVKHAITHYQNTNSQCGKLELVDIVKVNLMSCSSLVYFITFKAKNSFGEIKFYQAKVSYGFHGGTDVKLVRERPEKKAEEQ